VLSFLQRFAKKTTPVVGLKSYYKTGGIKDGFTKRMVMFGCSLYRLGTHEGGSPSWP
jgi:hypothetical protein